MRKLQFQPSWVTLILVIQSLAVLVIFQSMVSFRFVRQAKAVCSGGTPIIFNFGDSNSDTGGIMAGMGYPIPLPEGRLHFGRSTGRLCDGRLIIDFLCESLNTHYLSPYLEALGSNFSNGANFAICGSRTLPRMQAFALYIQTLQFLHFRSRSLYLATQGHTGLLGEQDFRNALYMIDIGQNDMDGAFTEANGNFQHVLSRIPPVIEEIKTAIKTLYDNGARKFWVHNTSPMGCFPQKLAIPRNDDTDLDEHGCLKTYNNGAKAFNSHLSAVIDSLSLELKDATIVYVDIYSIKYELVANHSKYGFDNRYMACCGHGGPPYNYNHSITCMGAGFQVCDDGSKHISWDGVHYSEAANRVIASKILTTEYSRPRINYEFFCKG
ncbi:GDSL esterase/lipase [Rhynchospora pubera]|uniref:GDSL esterase/lipase n=1 Tax=Rhynchospora pubera TaxID=906938 RepID=A0AAV8DJ78_9POAL|nr:GDSL esterase/lipase [Rhynchospora pubera]KAJ4820774.1 GDSL esterase/lipase [Rhynchospora pubera]